MPMLTCKNHPDLAWSCKEQAITDGRYNGARHLFFFGASPFQRFSDGSGYSGVRNQPECPCPTSDLQVVPESEWPQ